MLGKPVSSEELQGVIDRQAAKEKFISDLEVELKAIKPGEGLVYEAKEDSDFSSSLGLSLLAGKVGGLKIITEDRKTYVYRPR